MEYRYKVKMSKIFHINHKVSAFKNVTFWLFLLTPMVSGLILGSFVWSPYSLGFDNLSYKIFLDVSKLPLGIMGLSFPIVGIYMFQFRTKQASELYLVSRKRDIETNKDKYLDSLIAMSLIVSRLNNHLYSLEQVLKVNSLSYEELTDRFNKIYSLWESIFCDSLYTFALSRLNQEIKKADALFLGASLDLTLNRAERFRPGYYSNIINELHLIHLKICKDESHCKCASLQEIYTEQSLCGLPSNDTLRDLNNEFERMNEYDNKIKNIENNK